MKRIALLVLLAACPKSGDKPTPNDPAGSGSAHAMLMPGDADSPIALPPAPPLPAVPASLPPPPANPRITPEAVALGELLFWDPRLSGGTQACATCHDPAHGYAGEIATAADGKKNLRRTPALVNLAWAKEVGWDGRYPSVADLLPPHIKGQLGDPIDSASARLDAVPLYHAHFARIGGRPRDAIVQALEAFVLTRYEGDAPWDRQERVALSSPGSATTDPVLAGYKLFMGKAQCGVCHLPPLYTDGGYHIVETNPLNDEGRGRVDPAHKGAFRTPTLRGAARRTTFFHQATSGSLDEVVSHYVHADNHIANADPVITKIELTADEQKQLVAFLNSLTAERPAPTKPVLP